MRRQRTEGKLIRSYKDLEVYTKSYDLVLEVYEATASYPPEERYGMTSQVRRAAISIPANIAEGYGKLESAAEFKRYLRMALGSCNEIEVLLNLSSDLGYLERETAKELVERYIVVQKKLYNLAQKWE